MMAVAAGTGRLIGSFAGLVCEPGKKGIGRKKAASDSPHSGTRRDVNSMARRDGIPNTLFLLWSELNYLCFDFAIL